MTYGLTSTANFGSNRSLNFIVDQCCFALTHWVTDLEAVNLPIELHGAGLRAQVPLEDVGPSCPPHGETCTPVTCSGSAPLVPPRTKDQISVLLLGWCPSTTLSSSPSATVINIDIYISYIMKLYIIMHPWIKMLIQSEFKFWEFFFFFFFLITDKGQCRYDIKVI